MNMYITPNDEKVISSSDSLSIQNAVKLAKETGLNKVVIPRMNMRTNAAEWNIEKAILLPDDIEIVLDNCYIRHADDTFDNIFRNENMKELPGNKPEEREQKNIFITGIGNAVIDGGKPNGLTEATSKLGTDRYIYQNNTILLHNVDNFAIENITIKNQRWWAINLVYASNGRLSNITFDARKTLLNQDGIDLRIGCHDIIIENIYGQTGDDMIALTVLKRPDWLFVESKDMDIYNVSIKNVVGSSVCCALVALRNTDGILLRDVTIDGVYDTSAKSDSLRPYAVVRVGQHAYFKERLPLPGETRNIYINNVHAQKGEAVMLNVALTDSYVGNVFCGAEALSGVTTSTKNDKWAPGGAYLKNVVIENIFDSRVTHKDKPILEFVKIKDEDAMENVVIKNILSDSVIVNEFE